MGAPHKARAILVADVFDGPRPPWCRSGAALAVTAARFFDAIAGRYERAYSMPAVESRRRVAAVIDELPPPPSRLLDLGVGTGRELTALLDAGYAPTGLDVSREMLERCSRRARPIPLLEADFWQPLPLDDASFDAAIALHGTLAHPPDGEALGRLAIELGRVVRTGGVWVVEAPSPAWLDRVESAAPAAVGTVRRTGPQTFVYTDRVAELSIDGRVLTEEQWNAGLGEAWSVCVRALGPLEWLIVATRGSR